MIWTEGNVRRIVLDMAAQIQKTPASAWNGRSPQSLDLHNDLGLDSLSRMALAAEVNDFFGLFATSLENYLLSDSVLDHWVEKILRARRERDEELVFLTSGTSGTPKRIRHRMEQLLFEARLLQELLPRPTEVITTVPAHHIYGLLYTVLLPALWQVPLRSVSEVHAATITADSLIIGTPFTWEYLFRTWAGSGVRVCQGVCSTAPLSTALFASLNERGVDLLEVYGSTETGGIAFRRSPEAPFRLFSSIRLLGDPPAWVAVRGREDPLPLPDRIERVSKREIRLLGRQDGAIQIAGVNVSVDHVQKIVADCPLVEMCEVYAKSVEGQPQLFCTIRLREPSDRAEKACRQWLAQHLYAPEMPRTIQFY